MRRTPAGSSSLIHPPAGLPETTGRRDDATPDRATVEGCGVTRSGEQLGLRLGELGIGQDAGRMQLAQLLKLAEQIALGRRRWPGPGRPPAGLLLAGPPPAAQPPWPTAAARLGRRLAAGPAPEPGRRTSAAGDERPHRLWPMPCRRPRPSARPYRSSLAVPFDVVPSACRPYFLLCGFGSVEAGEFCYVVHHIGGESLDRQHRRTRVADGSSHRPRPGVLQ